MGVKEPFSEESVSIVRPFYKMRSGVEGAVELEGDA